MEKLEKSPGSVKEWILSSIGGAINIFIGRVFSTLKGVMATSLFWLIRGKSVKIKYKRKKERGRKILFDRLEECFNWFVDILFIIPSVVISVGAKF